MSDFEQRQYLIQGELSLEDWQLSLQFLGKLGVTTAQYSLSDAEELPTVKIETALEAGTIPYRLSQIDSAEQYLSNEHLGEYWPEYRKSSENPGGKGDCLMWGINMLANPSPKGLDFRLSTEQQREYAVSLGVVAVHPRSKVGFADETLPGSYGLWGHPKYGNSVIQVGSFITSVRSISELDSKERPYSMDMRTIRFFLSLADKLESQIDPNNAEDL